MKPFALALLALACGAGGGIGGFAAMSAMVPVQPATPRPSSQQVFVPLGPMVVPVTDARGVFAGYVSVEVSLGVVDLTEAEVVGQRARVLDFVNRTVWKTPLGLDSRQRSIDTTRLRAVLRAAGQDVFGTAVRDVAITKIMPG